MWHLFIDQTLIMKDFAKLFFNSISDVYLHSENKVSSQGWERLKNIKMTVVVMVMTAWSIVSKKSKTVNSIFIHCLKIQIICPGLESPRLALRAAPLHFSFLPFCQHLKIEMMKLDHDFN